jgi:hypothetical protein
LRIAETKRAARAGFFCSLCELAAHLAFDVYIGENRKWLSGDHPTAQAGIARLRQVLALAISGIAPR